MDCYKVLGISKTATPDEIRSAYRRLALKHHPDRNPGNKEAARKFIEISQAYDVLSDEKRRRSYDLYGDAGQVGTATAQREYDGDDFARMFDMMNKVFGGSPFEDILTATSSKGKKKDVKPDEACKNCNGSGQVGSNFGFFAFQMACPSCLGSGRKKKAR